jgi:hypothetical protein
MKYFSLIITMIYVSLLFSGCSESLLDIPNPNEPTVETFWQTEDDFEKGINAAYSSLYRWELWASFLSFRYDIASDEGMSASPNLEFAVWNRFAFIDYDYWYANRGQWAELYVGIFRCNQVLEYIKGVEFSNSEKKQLIIAQAQFLRALYYSQVCLLWEKAALILTPEDGNYLPSDASEEQIWAQVEIDLKAAASALVEKWDDANLGRATQGAARTLLAKAYMQQHKYAEAKGELQWLIDREGSLYGLMDDYMDNFTHLNENNKESVFEIQFDDKNTGENGNGMNMGTGFYRTMFFGPAGIGFQDGQACPWLMDEYRKEKTTDNKYDIRLYRNLFHWTIRNNFPDKDQNVYSYAYWFDAPVIRKYSTEYYRKVEDYHAPNNFRLLRYADVLLMYAECIAETNGSLTDAAAYVNKVRQRSSVKLPTLQASIYADCLTSKDKFLKRLQMERSLELCFEGHRWADLKRWGLLTTQAGIDELKSRDSEFNNFVLGKHHRSPIPQIEVDNSEGKLTQNPGY